MVGAARAAAGRTQTRAKAAPAAGAGAGGEPFDDVYRVLIFPIFLQPGSNADDVPQRAIWQPEGRPKNPQDHGAGPARAHHRTGRRGAGYRRRAALAGNLLAAQLLLSRMSSRPPAGQAIAGRTAGAPVAGTLTEKADAVLLCGRAGELAPDVGAQLIGAVASAARITEIARLADRLAAIERALSAR